jgi:hypothetical protein
MDITLIPVIMRRKGWLNGARLQDIWFAGAPNSDPERGAPDTTTIRMDSWALTFPRCATAYSNLVSQKLWLSHDSQRWLSNKLLEKGLFQTTRTTFGNLARPVPQVNADYYIHESGVGSITDPLDDMYAALGRFSFRVAVSGSVVPAGTIPMPPGASMTRRPRPGTLPQHSVQIERVGIYIFDSFDFNGFQFLGFWSPTDVTRAPIPGYVEVWNSTYRDWRSKNGRGGDFLVYSDMKILRRDPPDTFMFPLSTQLP